MRRGHWLLALSAISITTWAVAMPAGDPADTAPFATSFTRRYAGELDYKHKVQLTLTRNRNQLTGRYSYTRVGKPLSVQGSLKGREVRLEEFEKGKCTGQFEGRFATPTILTGTWQSEDGQRTMDFRLAEIPPKVARPFTGNWSWENQGAAFRLDLIQRGNTVEGAYTATTRNATRVDADSSIRGTVRGNTANVHFVSAYGGNRGTARITRVGSSLRWQVTSEGVGGYYAPRRATLRRDK